MSQCPAGQKNFEKYFSADKFIFILRADFNAEKFVNNEVRKIV